MRRKERNGTKKMKRNKSFSLNSMNQNDEFAWRHAILLYKFEWKLPDRAHPARTHYSSDFFFCVFLLRYCTIFGRKEFRCASDFITGWVREFSPFRRGRWQSFFVRALKIYRRALATKMNRHRDRATQRTKHLNVYEHIVAVLQASITILNVLSPVLADTHHTFMRRNARTRTKPRH